MRRRYLKCGCWSTLREVWDKGDNARFNRSGYDFRPIFIANSEYVDKRAGVHAMRLTPLRDRITLNMKLAPPTPEDIAAVAKAYSPDNNEVDDYLAKLAASAGNVRATAKAHNEARIWAGADPLSTDHIKLAISQNGDL